VWLLVSQTSPCGQSESDVHAAPPEEEPVPVDELDTPDEVKLPVDPLEVPLVLPVPSARQ
jgi:hypothetical protein